MLLVITNLHISNHFLIVFINRLVCLLHLDNWLVIYLTANELFFLPNLYFSTGYKLLEIIFSQRISCQIMAPVIQGHLHLMDRCSLLLSTRSSSVEFINQNDHPDHNHQSTEDR